VYEFRDDAASDVIVPLRKKEEDSAEREESIEAVDDVMRAVSDSAKCEEECDNWSSNEVSYFEKTLNISKTRSFFLAFFGSPCSSECAQSTDLKIYRVSHLKLSTFEPL